MAELTGTITRSTLDDEMYHLSYSYTLGKGSITKLACSIHFSDLEGLLDKFSYQLILGLGQGDSVAI